jgi:FHA domain
LSVTCPNGHQSSTTDYCDQCGALIEAPPTPSTPPAPPTSAAGAPHTATLDAVSGGDEVDTSPAPRQQPCPQCGAPRTGDDRYCEGCGYDFVAAPAVTSAEAGDAAPAHPVQPADPAPDHPADPAPAPAPVVDWEAVTSADRAQFDRLAPAGLEFPTDYPERHFPLTRQEVVIGRTHSPAQPPDINLAGAPEDPAVSHRHALLERQDDGSYKLRDLGSTNGTTLNDDPAPVSRDTGAPVADGDRIHVGAWTTLTLRRRN